MELILGVDGGNTKTIALLATANGEIIGAGRAGSSDLYAAPSESEAVATIVLAVDGALAAAGASRLDISAAGFSLAGADWPEDFEYLQEALARSGLGSSRIIVNDAIGALRAGSADGPAVSAVCGTGFALGARGADGRLWHGSWWLEQFGARELASAVLWGVFRAELGIDPPTALTDRVLRFFGEASVEEVLHALTARRVMRPPADGLARDVLELAASDDRAHQIVRRFGTSIGDYVLAAARRVGIERDPFQLVLAGGVLRHWPSPLVDAIVERVAAGEADAELIRAPFEPCVGALFLGFDLLGIEVTPELQAVTASTCPGQTIFETLDPVV